MNVLIRRAVAGAVVLPLLLAGCGSAEQVGGGVNKNLKDAAGKRLGEGGSTTSVTAAAAATTVTTAAKTGLGIGQTTLTTKAPVTTPTTKAPPTTVAATTIKATTSTTLAPAQQKVALEIAINSDTGGKGQFDPNAGRVFTGSQVRFTNMDTVPRSIVDDKATFQSPMIAPGGVFIYTAKTAGTLNYHDGTRPYAVGSLEVIAR